MLVQRGVDVTYETIRQWSIKFGTQYARRLKRRQGRLVDTWHLDELFVTINGQRQYLWRVVDQDGDVIDILVQPRRDAAAARRFLRKLLKNQRQELFRLVTDKLGSYRAAHRTIMPLVTHDTTRFANNRAEVSHQPCRQRERQMRGFKSPGQAQRFLHVHGTIQKSVSTESAPAEVGAPSDAASTIFQRVGCGDSAVTCGFYAPTLHRSA